jgi:molecular chaperone HtpG
MYLKEDQTESLEEKHIKEVTKTHSQFIGYPIKLLVHKEYEKEISDDEVEDENQQDKPVCMYSLKVFVYQLFLLLFRKSKKLKMMMRVTRKKNSNKKKKKKKIEEKHTDEEKLNKQKPIWTRNPDDISTEKYAEFY